ncbi:MAG: sulfur carrier protein ThiS adenylyltransferase ThiF [Bacteroidetes bacterium]|nr:sulfur carrier protein ThiS adenylyltransferase ThiF [Bacteroidota bacterium]
MLERLKKCTVGIAGCGGLGSNCAIALARVGIGKIIIADDDIVNRSNLNRQYYFLKQIGLKKTVALKENIRMIDPEVIVEAHDMKLTSHDIGRIFKDCDVIVEAFDLKEMKQMIAEAVISGMPGKPLIIGSGLAGWGRNNAIRTRKIDHIYVCGDGATEVSDHLPPLAPRVGIVANMQANQVLEILLGKPAL